MHLSSVKNKKVKKLSKKKSLERKGGFYLAFVPAVSAVVKAYKDRAQEASNELYDHIESQLF